MEKFRNYITALILALNQPCSYSNSVPIKPLPINSIPTKERKIDYQKRHHLPLEYHFDLPEVPKELLEKSELIARL